MALHCLTGADLSRSNLNLREALSAVASTIYGTYEYVSLISKVVQGETLWITAVDEADQLAGVLPLIQRQTRFGVIANSLPFFGSHGGPNVIGGSAHVELAILREYKNYCTSIENIAASTIIEPLKGFVNDSEIVKSVLGSPTDSRISLITDLQQLSDPVQFMGNLPDPRPRNIRKALRLGIEVSHGNEVARLEALHGIHIENTARINGLIKPTIFFELLSQELPLDYWTVFTGELNGEVIAALLLLKYGLTVEYFIPAVATEHMSTQGLSLVIFEAMKEMHKQGFEKWNWGGTWATQTGVYDFKRKWSTTENAYKYYSTIHDPRLVKAPFSELLLDAPYFYWYPVSLGKK